MLNKLKKDGLLLGIHLYVMLPVLLFVLLWLRWYIAVPLGALVLFGIYRAFMDEEPLWKPEIDRSLTLKLVVMVGLVCLWVLSSGVGASVAQFPDHYVRNELFKMLIDYEWPVFTYPSGSDNLRGISYYIGFWLPAALVAKWTTYQVGLIMLQIWSALGIFFVWLLMCERQKSVRIWYFAVFVFFGGMDAVGKWLEGNLYTQAGNSHEWWAIFYNFPGMTSHLFWAYNQAIYGWLIYCLIMRQTNNRNLLFIWCAALLTSTFAAVGLIPFVVYRALCNTDSDKAKARVVQGLKRCLSVANATGLILSLVLCSYLLANDVVMDTVAKTTATEVYAAEETQETQESQAQEGEGAEQIVVRLDENGNPVIDNGDGTVEAVEKPADRGEFKAWPKTTRMWMYLWFILLEVGVFFFLIYPSQGKKTLFWISLAVLLICPLIKVGYHLDFCERASIPAMLCLCEMVIFALREYVRDKRYVLVVMLIATLIVGSLTTFDTIRATMTETAATVENLVDPGQDVTPQLVSEDVVIGQGSNFSMSQDNFFCKYLSK